MAYCSRMKIRDPEAAGLCGLLRSAGWSAPAEPQKVYDKAIEVLHREERRFALSGGRSDRPFTRAVVRFSAFRYPGLFNDYDASNSDDDRLLRRIHVENEDIRKTVRSRYAHVNERLRRREFLKELVFDMVAKTQQAKVLYTSDEKTALEVARGEKSDCTELARYAYARLRLSGFSPRVVFVRNEKKKSPLISEKVSGAFHVMVAVRNPADPKEWFYIDLQNDGIVSEPRHKRFLDMHAVMNIYHHNLGVHYHEMRDEIAALIKQHRCRLAQSVFGRIVLGVATFLGEASVVEAERRFDLALRYDPKDALVHYSKAFLLWKSGAPKSVVRALTGRALQLMPDHEEAQILNRYVRE